MQQHHFQHLHSNQQNFHENSFFKVQNINRNIPKTAPRKTRSEANISSTGSFDISEEDFFGSMLSIDVQPIYNPKRVSKTPATGKRKRKNFDTEAIPIPKINTQKFHSQQEIQRASTTTSVIRPTRNNAISTAPVSHFISSNISQSVIQVQIPEPQTSNLIDPLTIKQIDTGNIQKKSFKDKKLSVSYSSLSQTKKMIQKPHSSYSNRSKSPKKKMNSDCGNILIKEKTKKEDDQITNKKVTIISTENQKEVSEEKNSSLPVKFDKKAFLKKLENDEQSIRIKSTISFANGRVLPSLHYQKEPDRYVIACAIHIEFSFNFFTLPTNPIIEKYLIIDEESYDLFDSNFEYSNRLYRSSKFIRIQKEILSNSCHKDPLTALLSVTPSLTRRKIEKQHFYQQMKILSPSNDFSSISLNELSNEILEKYPNNVTTDSAFPLIDPRFDCSKAIENGVIEEYSDDEDGENDKLDFCVNRFSCNLSNLNDLSSLLEG